MGTHETTTARLKTHASITGIGAARNIIAGRRLGIDMKQQTEHEEQKAVYQFCMAMATIYPALGMIYTIPNGFAGQHSARRYQLAEGMRPGFPDLGLPVSRGGYHGLFIELKRAKGQAPRPNQVAWLTALGDEGYLAVCCKGRAAAQDVLIKYITGEFVRNG